MPLKYRIHPAIGIARVGDSPDDFFIGPEAPGIPPTLKKPGDVSAPPGKYKDGQQRIKRQGARFRVYEFTEDAAGAVTHVREITVAEAQIEWEVHLANRKATAPRLQEDGRRNAGLPESKLIIDAGPHKIGGPNQAMKKLQGEFMETIDVRLGDLLTDNAGRLIVLGGFGKSQCLPANVPKDGKMHFANNDGWCDDISDGPVRATIKLNGSAETVSADSAWVVVAPPDFAPPLENVITLYDVVYDMMAKINPALAVGDKTKVSFTKDIYPIFRRVSNLHWVSAVAAIKHGEGGPAHFISRVKELASKDQSERAKQARDRIFRRLRNPKGDGGDMPLVPNERVPGAALTEVQYKRMERWAKGMFDADWTGAEPAPVPFDKLAEEDKPQALDRGALEACVGGPFFPGIEVSRLVLEKSTYDEKRPFRINAKLSPGALTERMAVPWQADFRACGAQGGADWWPGQRPIQVFRNQQRVEWVPSQWEELDMVKSWSQLGFVIEKKLAGRVQYAEDERSPKADG